MSIIAHRIPAARPQPAGGAPGWRALARALRRFWITPVQLWALMGAVVIAGGAAYWTLSSAVSDSGRSVQAVGYDTIPSIVYARQVSTSLSDMDADATKYLLLA